METWMYKCGICGTLSCFKENRGEIWFRYCSGCRSLQFHHKVVIAIDMVMGHVTGAYFYCKMDKEEEDEHSNTGTDQEK